MKAMSEDRHSHDRTGGDCADVPKLRNKLKRLALTLALAAIVLLATWMGGANGGYFLSEWAPVAILLAALILVGSLTGALSGANSRMSNAAVCLFAGYTGWTFASMLWSANRGDAWVGAGQSTLYLLAFGAAVALVASGAYRRWALVASVLGPAGMAAYTLSNLVAGSDTLFIRDRLVGTVGYHSGEAAFLLVPFWVAVYLAGSRQTPPILRGLVLAGATLCIEMAIFTQSRGALAAMAVSLPIFFAFSGQRLRGALALAPVVVALIVTFADINAVYLAFKNETDPAAMLDKVIPAIWVTVAASGLYAFFWGLVDRRWSLSARTARFFGVVVASVVIVSVMVVAPLSAATSPDGQMENPVSWVGKKWEAFKKNDATGQDQSRYLSASGTGRYTLWQVAWEDFASSPVLGIGTHNYEATYYQLREQGANSRGARQPHALPLEILSERGILGGVLFFGFLACCLAAGLRQRFGYLGADGKALVAALVAAVSYWFVYSCAEWFWQLPAVTLPAIIYLAALAAPWRRVETQRSRSYRRPVAIVVSILAVASMLPLFIAHRNLAQSYATENPWMALQSVERAQGFNPLDPQLSQREAELAIQIGNWPRVVEAYDRATKLNHQHYAPYALLAQFYEQRGEPEKALPLYREALTLNPLDKELNRSVTRLEEQAGAE